LDNPAMMWKRRNVLYVIPHCHSYADGNPDAYLRLIGKIIQKYEGTPKDVELHGDPGKVTVAVHIRRGDVTPVCEQSFRFTSNQYARGLLHQVLSTLDELRLPRVVNLYSEGRAADFAELANEGVILHLGDSAFTAFNNLVCADILIMARSSFSYSAGLFSRGIKVYDPFWHKPLSEWLVAGSNGEIDTARLRTMVANKVEARPPAG
jgi:hypothetical protein